MSTIAKKTFPTLKQLHANLTKELVAIQNKSAKIHAVRDVEKQQAKLQYQKLTLIKEGKDFRQVEQQLKDLRDGKVVESDKLTDTHIYDNVVAGTKDTPRDLNYLQNVITFLNSQRIYTELVERYNPGLSMDQSENVRKTANKVGLSVPE